MAQKDYIKRPNPKANTKRKPAKKASAKKSATNSAPQTARVPVIPLIVVTLILGGFGYFLWSINGAADDPQLANQTAPAPSKTKAQAKTQNKVQSKVQDKTPKQVAKVDKVKTVTKSTAKTQQAALPPPPEKEDWQYIDELKNKTVDVETTLIEKKGPFLMQCATFKDARRAEAFKAQLALLSFESRVKVTKNRSGTFHRVQLGPYETNRDALRAKHKLSKHKISGCKIWLWS